MNEMKNRTEMLCLIELLNHQLRDHTRFCLHDTTVVSLLCVFIDSFIAMR